MCVTDMHGDTPGGERKSVEGDVDDKLHIGDIICDGGKESGCMPMIFQSADGMLAFSGMSGDADWRGWPAIRVTKKNACSSRVCFLLISCSTVLGRTKFIT